MTNEPSLSRRRLGQRLADVIDRYGLPLRQVAKESGINLTTLRSLRVSMPHAKTISRLALYLEKVARERRKKGAEITPTAVDL